MRNFKLFYFPLVERLFKTTIQLILISWSIQIGAQRATDYFTYTNRASRNFTGAQVTQLNRMISNPLYKGHYYVDIKELTTYSTDGTITISLPQSSTRFINQTSNDIDGDGTLNLNDVDQYDPCRPTGNNNNCTSLIPTNQVLYTFEPIKINTLSPSEYTYYGEWNPCDENNNGYISIIAKNGDINGQININEKVYEIHDLGGRKNILVEWDNSKFPTNECSTTQSNSFKDRHEENTINSRSGGCNVRVLVLYTTAAALLMNPTARATFLINQTNQIASNSKAMVGFSLAAVLPLTGFTETTGSGGINATFAAFTAFPLTNTLRNANFADLVVLLTDSNDPSVSGRAGDAITPTSAGLSVVEIDFAAGRLTFSHELAHNFGCFHDDATSTNARGKSFNNGCFATGFKSLTCLALAGASESRIMHYSNPNVTFKCRATGNSDRNNAGQLSSAGCTVAANRADPPPTLAVVVNGPETGIPGQSYTYCATISNCPNVLSIQWSYSLDGLHYTSVPSGNTACVTLTMPLHGSIYTRVRVICQGGGDVTEFWETYNEKENPKFNGCNWGQGPALSAKQSEQTTDFTLTPNPTNGTLNIEFDVIDRTKLRFAIYDNVGIEKKILANEIFEQGNHKLSFNISEYLNANYFIQKVENGKILAKQLIKF